MLEIEPGTVIALSPGIVLHSLPDQGWYHAFSVENGDQYNLNRTSFWVLEKISNGIEWEQLIEDFINNFEVSLEEGQADLSELVKELHNQNIIGRWENGKS
ncbi:PqqD family protein [Chloroflexota bacterium]